MVVVVDDAVLYTGAVLPTCTVPVNDSLATMLVTVWKVLAVPPEVFCSLVSRTWSVMVSPLALVPVTVNTTVVLGADTTDAQRLHR